MEIIEEKNRFELYLLYDETWTNKCVESFGQKKMR